MNTDSKVMHTALYAGSFTPFTVGHMSVLQRALRLFDRVVVMVGINADKPEREPDIDYLRSLIDSIDGAELLLWKGLTVDAAAEVGADWLVRGVRSVADFEYERNLADINRKISGLETVFLPATPELSMISSSMVRELRSYGHDVSSFLPPVSDMQPQEPSDL